MAFTDDGLLGAGIQAVQGLLGFAGTKYQADRQHGENEWAMRESERISGSAHQREVADLKAAGLNPILSATHGGASSPQAVGASQPDFGAAAARFGSDARSVVDIINSLKTTAATVRNMDASTAKSHAEALYTLKNADNISTAKDVGDTQAALNRQLANLKRMEAKLAGAEAESIKGSSLYQSFDGVVEQIGKVLPFFLFKGIKGAVGGRVAGGFRPPVRKTVYDYPISK